MITSCLSCGKEGKLLACTQCKTAKYCSRDCQKEDWKRHKKWCKIALQIPLDSAFLQANPHNRDIFMNMDQVLEYAGSYMKNLKHMHIYIPEVCIIGYLKFAPRNLKEFLEARPNQLCSFSLHFAPGFNDAVRMMTDGGRALLSLATHQQHSLYTLMLGYPCFDEAADLIKLLSAFKACKDTKSSLRLFSLCDASVGAAGTLWSQKDTSDIATAIESLDGLDSLALSQIEDGTFRGRNQELSELLSNKPNLRCFELSGLDPRLLTVPFGRSQTGGRARVGGLTDHSMKIIVEKVGGSIQELNLDFQTQITPAGLETILRGCPNLVFLTILGAKFTPEELERLLPLSPGLRKFSFGDLDMSARRNETVDRWIPAILATEGRTVIFQLYAQLEVSDDKLPPRCMENMKDSQQVLAKAKAAYANPEVTNIWNFLL